MQSEVLKEFNEKFPYKLAEVINDFGSPVKGDIEKFITKQISKAIEEVIKIIDNKPIPAREGTGTAIQEIKEEIRQILK